MHHHWGITALKENFPSLAFLVFLLFSILMAKGKRSYSYIDQLKQPKGKYCR